MNWLSYKDFERARLCLNSEKLNNKAEVSKSYHLTVSMVFHNFSQFSLNIQVSQIHDVVHKYVISFVTLAETNFPWLWRKKGIVLAHGW